MKRMKVFGRSGALVILAVAIGCEAQSEHGEAQSEHGEMERVSPIPDHVVDELDAIASEALDRLARQNPTVDEIEAVLRGEADAAELFGMTDAEYAALGRRLMDASSGIDPTVPLPPHVHPHKAAEMLYAMANSVQYKRRIRCRWIGYTLCLGAAALASGPNIPAYVVASAACACGFCEIGESDYC